MTDAELDSALSTTRNKVQLLHDALALGSADATDPSAAIIGVLGKEQRAYAAKLHSIFSDVRQSKEGMKLRAPRPAPRRPGDERGFQAIGAMLATKLEAEQEIAAQAAVSEAQGSTRRDVDAHNQLAAAADSYIRDITAQHRL
jgi:hypothetical protein